MTERNTVYLLPERKISLKRNNKMTEFPGKGWAGPYFQLAKNKTLAVPMTLHEAARRKLMNIMNGRGKTSGYILLQGGEDGCQYDSDTELIFRQDSWFNYLFGVKESGVFGAISLVDGHTTLFIPKLPDEYRVWCGTIFPPSHFRLSYSVDEVLYVEDLNSWILKAVESSGANAAVHLLKGLNSDSGLESRPASFEALAELESQSRVDYTSLHHALSTARLTKSIYEVEVMRYCAYVASNA